MDWLREAWEIEDLGGVEREGGSNTRWSSFAIRSRVGFIADFSFREAGGVVESFSEGSESKEAILMVLWPVGGFW